MKITGGSFGHKGSAYVAGRVFAVEGITKKDYRAADIKAVDARVEKSRSFGVFGFIVGAVLFTFLGMLVFGVIGGFGQWFTPILNDFSYIPFNLSDTVLIAFMTTTTTTVLGLYGIAAYWLYGNGNGNGNGKKKNSKK